MALRICVLGSGSKGNCTLIEGEKTRLLIDAGRLGTKYISARLEELGLKFKDITAIIATHAHGDHIDQTTHRMITGNDIPLYAHAETLPAIMRRTRAFRENQIPASLLESFESTCTIGEFRVSPVDVPHGNGWGHDHVGRPVAFLVEQLDGGSTRAVGVATDLGIVPEELIETFAGADVIAIESNHDIAMELKSDRPDYLVDWVLGERGHLSNPQAAQALARIVRKSAHTPKAVLLAHLSEECNSPALALETARSHLEEAGFGSIPLHACGQREPSPVIEV
ncbi:MAG: MBL fold metallo-hydrolase, partial [bacterium]